jgi:transketolase
MLTRQAVAHLDRGGANNPGVSHGAYLLADVEDGVPDVILIGTGSEVSLCVMARENLKNFGVKARVVSMPSWDLFEAQDASYRESVLPPGIKKRVTVEAASPIGWHRWARDEGTSLLWNDLEHRHRARRFLPILASRWNISRLPLFASWAKTIKPTRNMDLKQRC